MNTRSLDELSVLDTRTRSLGNLQIAALFLWQFTWLAWCSWAGSGGAESSGFGTDFFSEKKNEVSSRSTLSSSNCILVPIRPVLALKKLGE